MLPLNIVHFLDSLSIGGNIFVNMCIRCRIKQVECVILNLYPNEVEDWKVLSKQLKELIEEKTDYLAMGKWTDSSKTEIKIFNPCKADELVIDYLQIYRDHDAK